MNWTKHTSEELDLLLEDYVIPSYVDYGNETTLHNNEYQGVNTTFPGGDCNYHFASNTWQLFLKANFVYAFLLPVFVSYFKSYVFFITCDINNVLC